MRILAVILMLMSVKSWANCDSNNDLGGISFDKNSSYFGKAASQVLDAILDPTAPGYLRLEFAINSNEGDEQLRQYNLWLAQRRIDRVREYLGNKGFAAPVVSLIRTAATDTSRNLQLVWCEESDSAPKSLVADR
ncbi:hypothetical protein JYB88_02605 [Shewanella cyperi]|uniref:OmpA-like domain-containing protein n=1 Tax=Shewanella cyperi TaxID=2814292 RepID=A0A975AKV9_9GAMM|nr:hypothetical protein [Shewanella cyperi]QSX30570.1 hypothetical protein JYB88_02605 [Shewanella cyperi]